MFSAKSRRITSAVLVIYLVGLSAIFLLYAVPIQSRAQSAPDPINEGLSLLARPPVLPADGGQYQSLVLELINTSSSVPIVPSADVSVLLTSSNPEAGTVPSSVVFQAGQIFLSIPFQTTTLPGSTTISAFASGYAPGNVAINTLQLGGIPSALQVSVAPNKIPPGSNFVASVAVQAVDSLGNPVKLVSPLTVSLGSSNAQIGSVPSSIVIPAGQSFAQTTFTPSYVAGVTQISASAGGFSSGSASVTTIGPIPRRLVVSIAPSVLSDASGTTAYVSIQLQDNVSQTPAVDASPVNVVLTSSANGIATPSSTLVTIPAGQTYVMTTITAQGNAGSANITASAQGFVKGSAVVVTEAPVGGPSGLALYFAPNTLLPNNETYPGVAVAELVNSNGNPATSSSSTVVYARSSDNATMQVNDTAQSIPSGSTYLTLNVQTTYLPGTVGITVQSPGLSSSTSSLLSFGTVPNALSMQFAPSVLLADGQSYSSIIVGLINSVTGSAAVAPVSTVVTLSANTSTPGGIPGTVTIPAGASYVVANFTATELPGVVGITATAANYGTAEAFLSTVSPGATRLAVYAAPFYLVANNQTFENAVVQLQDSSGAPERTSVPVPVELACSSAAYCSVPTSVTVEPGQTFASIPVTTTTNAGVFNVTAFAVGYVPGSVEMNSTLVGLTAQITLGTSSLSANSQTEARILVESGGVPIQGAVIKWVTSSDAQFSQVQNTTNANGVATAVVTSGSTLGTIQIEAVVEKSGYLGYLASTSLTVTSAVTSSFWTYVIIAVVVAVVGVGVLFFMRRRKSHPIYEEESQPVENAPVPLSQDYGEPPTGFESKT